MTVQHDQDRAAIEGVETWDANKEEFVSAGAVEEEYDAHKDGDGRNVRGLQYDSANPDAERTRLASLNGGDLSLEQAKNLDIEAVRRINPKSDVPAKILHGALKQSWTEAKHQLTKGDDNLKAKQLLMKKLWEFRQWDHDLVLQQVQETLPKEGDKPHDKYPEFFPDPDFQLPAKALTEWKAAGSTSLTSDIDVNLKGAATELAVKEFNQQFKKVKGPRKGDKWTREAGVVYDVNVYALDFMHGIGYEDGAGNIVASKEFGPAGFAHKKDGREFQSGGKGFSVEEEMETDRASQAMGATLKLRLYMTPGQWKTYKTDTLADAEAKGGVEYKAEMQVALSQVEAKFTLYKMTLHQEMCGVLGIPATSGKTKLDDSDLSGIDQLKGSAAEMAGKDEVAQEDTMMAAANRVYERKLVDIAKLRGRLTALQGELDGGSGRSADEVSAELDRTARMLREALTEAAMYANEAYVTDGAVNHAVVGLQIGISLSQTNSEAMNAVTENQADSLKEISRHGDWLGEASYKAGKYLWRMADASKNMGVADADTRSLFEAGYVIANVIKKKEVGDDQKEDESAGKMHDKLGLNGARGSKDGVSDLVTTVNEVARTAHQHYAGNLGDKSKLTAAAQKKHPELHG